MVDIIEHAPLKVKGRVIRLTHQRDMSSLEKEKYIEFVSSNHITGHEAPEGDEEMEIYETPETLEDWGEGQTTLDALKELNL